MRLLSLFTCDGGYPIDSSSCGLKHWVPTTPAPPRSKRWEQRSWLGSNIHTQPNPTFPSRIFQELAPDLRQAADDIVTPDLRRAVGDILNGKEDIQAARQEAAGIWSDIKQAVSELGGGGGPSAGEDSTTELAWDVLKRDAKRAAKGVFGDVSMICRAYLS